MADPPAHRSFEKPRREEEEQEEEKAGDREAEGSHGDEDFWKALDWSDTLDDEPKALRPRLTSVVSPSLSPTPSPGFTPRASSSSSVSSQRSSAPRPAPALGPGRGLGRRAQSPSRAALCHGLVLTTLCVHSRSARAHARATPGGGAVP